MNDSRIAEAVELMRAGDETGLRRIQELCGQWIYNKAYQILRIHEDAQDAYQEVFLKAWCNLHQYKPEHGGFVAWLGTVAHNAIVDIYRRNGRQREIHMIDFDNSSDDFLGRQRDESALPDELAERNEALAEINAAIVCIPKREHRVAWVLRHVEDLSIAEISGVLNQKENTVKVWVHRASLALRRNLGAMEV